MNPFDDSRLVRPACRLAICFAAGAAVFLVGRPVTGAAPVMSAGAADQVQPERRLRRLGQLYEELQKLLAEHRTAVSTLENLERAQNEATAAQTNATNRLQAVLLEEYSIRDAMRKLPQAVAPRLPGLIAQEDVLRQQIVAMQHSLAELQPQWTAASQRVSQLSQAVQSDLPKKREEWLWLCDPLGKLGANAHRGSIEVCSRQITQDNRFSLSYLARGLGYLHTEQYVKALDDFAKVVALDKEMADVAAAGRGWTYARMQRNSQAAAEFRKAVKWKPTSPFVELVLGHACAEQQKDKFAEAHFRKAVNLAEHLPQALEALAFFLATRRADDPISAKQAIQHATKACKMTDWDQWVYLDTLAVACAAAGDFQLGSQWGTKALQRAPREYQTDLQKRLDLYAAKKPYQPQ